MSVTRFSRMVRPAILWLPLLLAACSGSVADRIQGFVVSPTEMRGAVEDAATGASATAPTTGPGGALPTPTIAAESATPVLMCTPPACAPGEGYACPSGDCPGGCGTVCVTPTPVTGPLGPAPTDWENLESWLATLWRSNVNPAAARAALQASGMQRTLADWAAADFDGDLMDEWVVVLYDQSLPGVPFGSPGDLWIVNGNGVVFRYYTAPSQDIYEFIAPTIIALADMTGDGLAELIADARLCGAHTCYGNYRVIGQAGGELVDLVSRPIMGDGDPGNTISMSTPEIRVEDFDGDGLAELIVHGGAIGSVGAGVVRQRTEIWGWDGAAVTLAETILDPTPYRHHILYEANDAMAAGDLDRALALYEAAINEGALLDDSFFNYTPEQTRADISAFAAFRLILIDLLQGNPDRAGSRLAWLGATYPNSAAAEAAAALVNEWAGPDGAAALCDRIEAGLASRQNPTGVLADMGYGNPSLGVTDFCP